MPGGYCSSAQVAHTNLALREEKSKRELPARACIFLGTEVDTSGGNATAKVPEHRRVVLQRLIRAMASEEVQQVNRRELASLVGLLSFFSKAIPSSRAFLRRLYGCLHQGLRGSHDCDVDVLLTAEAKRDLKWWASALVHLRDACVLRGEGVVTIKQHTDASGGGWGCTIERHHTPLVSITTLASGRSIFLTAPRTYESCSRTIAGSSSAALATLTLGIFMSLRTPTTRCRQQQSTPPPPSLTASYL
jgi:hypothetical protein